MDGALLHHLRRESPAYSGVLLDKDDSMKESRLKKWIAALKFPFLFFTMFNILHNVTCVLVIRFPSLQRMKLS